MTQIPETTRSLAGALLLTLLVATGATAQPTSDLVSVRAGVPERSVSAIAARFVDIDHSLLRAGGESFRIELPDGPVEFAMLDQFEQRGAGDLTWRGRIRFEPDSRVVLTVKNGFVTGAIRSRLGLYEIRPYPGGGHVIEKLDTQRFPECGGGRPTSIPAQPASPTRRPLGEDAFSIGDLAGTVEATTSGDLASQIQLMSLYTPEARDGAGGTAQIQVLIQGAVDAANTAFADSGMEARFELVFVGEASYSDSLDMDADLDWLRSDSGVAALREQYAADMVSLVVDRAAYCGIGYVMRNPGANFADWAFQVTHRACAVGNLSFAHEHGHNMGFEHDPANGANSGSASYDWSFGHFVNGSFRTVMAYSSECTLGCNRVARFSDPATTYSGYATGMSEERDNSRTGNSTASIVANFRSGATCGNGVREGAEECDGGDLAGASCDAIGCGGGTASCTASCTLDYSACLSCGVCDFDGVCESGEDCGNCPSDCTAGAGATCGNGVCEAADGEDCLSCAEDCAGKTGGKPSSRFCCGDGDGPNPVSCGDTRCTSSGFECTGVPAPASCCGDGACDGSESGSSCSLDCGAPPSCGDGVCDTSESPCSCSLDCGAPPTTEFLLCTDGVDNDCDGLFDCSDGDCTEDSACGVTCEPLGASCSSNADCCAGRCRNSKGVKTCRL